MPDFTYEDAAPAFTYEEAGSALTVNTDREKRVAGLKAMPQFQPEGNLGYRMLGAIGDYVAQPLASFPQDVLNLPVSSGLLPQSQRIDINQQLVPLVTPQGVMQSAGQFLSPPGVGIPVPPQPSAPAQILAGGANALGGMATPANLAIGPMLGTESLVGNLLKAVFGSQMLGGVPGEVGEAVKQVKDPAVPLEQKAKAVVQPLLSGAMGLGVAMPHGGGVEKAGVKPSEGGPTLKDLNEMPLTRQTGPEKQLTDSPFIVSPQGHTVQSSSLSPREMAEFQREAGAESRQTDSGQERVVNTVRAGLEQRGFTPEAINDVLGVGREQTVFPATAKEAKANPQYTGGDLAFREEFEKAATKGQAGEVPGRTQQTGFGKMTEGQKERLKNWQAYTAKLPSEELERMRASLTGKPGNALEVEMLKTLEGRLGPGSDPAIPRDTFNKVKAREDQDRPGFSLDGPMVLNDPEVFGFPTGAKLEPKQMEGRLENLARTGKISPAELDVYKKAGLGRFLEGKPGVGEVAKWMQENGPKVETRVLKSGGEANRYVTERARVQHELETRGVRFDDQHVDSKDPEVIKLWRRYVDLGERTQETDASFDPDVYRSIAPKDKDQTVVMVRVPRTRDTREHGLYSKSTINESILHDDVLHHGNHFGDEDINVLGWARIQYEEVEGKKVAHIIEQQDDLIDKDDNKKFYFTGDGIPNLRGKKFNTFNEANDALAKEWPITKDRVRRVLKAAIDEARKNGAEGVVVSDAETAMMTEGHDTLLKRNVTGTGDEKLGDIGLRDPNTGQIHVYGNRHAAEASLRLNETMSPGSLSIKGLHIDTVKPEDLVYKGSQSEGMRLNYDRVLPSIMEELTGGKGERVEMGEHQRAFKEPVGGTTIVHRTENAARDYNRNYFGGAGRIERVEGGYRINLGGPVPRENLIFRNPDGTPKTSASGLHYPLPKESEIPHSLMGKTRPKVTVESPGKEPSGDRATYDSLVKQFKEEKDLTKKFEIQGKIEKLKNENKGMPPSGNQETIEKMGIKQGASGLDVIKKVAADKQYFGPEQAALADFLARNFERVLSKAKVDLGHDPSHFDRTGEKRAAYDFADHTAYLNIDENKNVQAVTLEELTHAATAWQYKYPKTAKQMEAVRDIQSLMKQVVESLPPEVAKYNQEVYTPKMQGFFEGKDRADVGDMPDAAREHLSTLYYLSNPREFLAAVFHDEGFRNMLDGIQAEGRSLLAKAWDGIKKLLGISPDSILDRAIDNLSHVGQEGQWGDREKFGMVDLDELGSDPANPFREIADQLRKERKAFGEMWSRREVTTSDIPAAFNRAENKARIMARQVANDVDNRLRVAMGMPGRIAKEGPPGLEIAQKALTFVVEASGDRAAIVTMEGKLAGKTGYFVEEARRALGYARTHWDKIAPVAAFYEKVNRQEVKAENARGIQTLFRDGYVAHVQDVADDNALLFEQGKQGISGAYVHERTHATFADSIAAGVKPVSLNAIDLMEHRLSAGQRRINRAELTGSLKHVVDPGTGEPVAVPTQVKTRADGSIDVTVPRGYKKMFLGDDVVGVHKGYEGLLDSLVSDSKMNKNVLSRSLMGAAHTMKHFSLLFDFYHPIRLWAYAAPLRATLKEPGKFLESTKEGLWTLDYNQPTLDAMAKRGEIDPTVLPEIQRKRGVAAVAIKTGFNVGRISDNLYSHMTQAIPYVGKYNKWLFDKFQRGLMMETYVIEFDRRKGMEPGLSDEVIGRKVSKDLNTRFGNLGNESVFKSKTFQDMLRVCFLAPQWNEGLIRSEVGALTQAGQAVGDLVNKKRVITGALVRDAGLMFAALFIGNQVINLVTRGKPTWENKEEQPGAKISAFIPDKMGSSEGFFINPFALSGEVTHTLIDRAEKDKSVVGAVGDYLSNKESNLGRVAQVLATRKDWKGDHLSDWKIVKEAAREAVPVPIQAPAIADAVQGKEAYPGANQQRLMSSLGLKTDRVQLSPTEKVARQAGKPIGEMGAGDRARAKKALPRGSQGGEAAAVKAVQHEFELQRVVREAMPKDVSDWLDKNKLNIGGYQESPSVARERVPLTDAEKAKEQDLVIKEFTQRLRVVKKGAEDYAYTPEQLQKRVNVVLTAARKHVRGQVRSSLGHE